MLAEALKTYPSTGSLNTEIADLDEVRPIFTDLVSDLKKLVKKQAEHVMLPMECHYLNKCALVSVVSKFGYLHFRMFMSLFKGWSTASTHKTFYVKEETKICIA